MLRYEDTPMTASIQWFTSAWNRPIMFLIYTLFRSHVFAMMWRRLTIGTSYQESAPSSLPYLREDSKRGLKSDFSAMFVKRAANEILESMLILWRGP